MEYARIEKQLLECSDKGVMPFSTLTFKYDGQNKLFRPQSLFDKFISIPEDLPINVKKSIASSPLRKGIVNKLVIKTSHHEFEIFQNDFLDVLLGQGYLIDSGELSLTTYRLTGYNEGTYTDNELILGRHGLGKNRLELRIGDSNNIASHSLESIESWFSELKQKYQPE